MAAAAGAARAEEAPRVLVLGDSLMASNRMLGGSVAQALGIQIGAPVTDQSVSGARYFNNFPGMGIETQLRAGPWDYVVMNGGGNDLLFGCGCGDCGPMMDRLISEDGKTGAIPEMVGRLREAGSKVIYTGYMRTPGLTSPVESCGPLGDEMDARIQKLDKRVKGMWFVPLADLVTQDGDRSFHGVDLVHPSMKGSAAIAARVAKLIDG